MSERKVLNKYYPPDFDPTKIPKIRRPKNYRKGVFSIRLMAPFNMRCNTCGEYIYKGKKFNSRKETVENENYLGLHIFRFYIKCPRCIAEIAFKTDPQSTDYVLEAGATRNFEATRTAEKMALQEQQEKEAEEANNPMKVLENRTKASCQEMEMLETLEELRELRHKHATVDHEQMIQQTREDAQRMLQLQEEEDEAFVRSVFGKDGSGIVVKRLESDSSEDTDGSDDAPPAKVAARASAMKPTDILTTQEPSTSSSSSSSSAFKSSRDLTVSMSNKSKLMALVKPKSSLSAKSAAETSDAKCNGSDVVKAATASGVAIPTASTDVIRPTAVTSSGLAGLGAYSDSDSVDSE